MNHLAVLISWTGWTKDDWCDFLTELEIGLFKWGTLILSTIIFINYVITNGMDVGGFILLFLFSVLIVISIFYAHRLEERYYAIQWNRLRSGEPSESLAALNLANQILRYGYENRSALALIDALQIFSENPTKPFEAIK